jgi:GGDEF domain-containing protein
LKIAWIGPETGVEGLVTFADTDALLSDETQYDAVWVDAANASWAKKELWKIRKAHRYAYAPLFVNEETEGAEALLHDGVAWSKGEVERTAARILQRRIGLDDEALQNTPGLRLLTYLYLRPGAKLAIHRHWRYEKAAIYPIAEAINDGSFETVTGLELLERRGLLEREELLERLRLCPKCEKPHHNFIDTCPTCHTIAIRKTQFVHCFTCGYVGPESEFYHEGIFVCPNCKTELRHIGADYDRPMESYVCENGHKFIEPDVLAECLACGALNEPDTLSVRELHAYALSAEGALAVRAGEIGDIYAILETANFVHPDYFQSLVDWLLKLHRRAPDEVFSILAIRLENIPELITELGRDRVVEFMDEFGERLREMLRTTDITTRTNETDIWVLLPKTPAEGCRRVEERVETLQELIAYREHHISLGLASYSVDERAEEVEDARFLMALLRSELSERSHADGEGKG